VFNRRFFGWKIEGGFMQRQSRSEMSFTNRLIHLLSSRTALYKLLSAFLLSTLCASMLVAVEPAKAALSASVTVNASTTASGRLLRLEEYNNMTTIMDDTQINQMSGHPPKLMRVFADFYRFVGQSNPDYSVYYIKFAQASAASQGILVVIDGVVCARQARPPNW
jgi:hypothetical protein